VNGRGQPHMPKKCKSVHMCQSYSKPKVERFFETQCRTCLHRSVLGNNIKCHTDAVGLVKITGNKSML